MNPIDRDIAACEGALQALTALQGTIVGRRITQAELRASLLTQEWIDLADERIAVFDGVLAAIDQAVEDQWQKLAELGASKQPNYPPLT